MAESITVTLPADLQQAVNELTHKEGISPDQFISRAVKEYVFLRRLGLLREKLSATAQAKGVVTDQDVFDRVS
ncbi:MAG TPA: CopG family transcriptional regulator [Planctomycetota bacterium]|jgi:metal-responsive CopG/Arc/MetJ family transcriptional regulator